MSLYSDLDVMPDATQADAGGKPEHFDRVQKAAMILLDPDRRSRYDRTGDDGSEPDNSLSVLTEILMSAFDRSMQEDGWEKRDIMQVMQVLIRTDRLNAEMQIRGGEAHAVKIKDAMKRLRYTGDGINPIGIVLDQRLAGVQSQLAQARKMIENFEAALKKLKLFGWDWDRAPPMNPSWEPTRSGHSGLFADADLLRAQQPYGRFDRY
jgi:curved DNA-binding protein CbpA